MTERKTRTALVTGANRGIGLAIAQGLADLGTIKVLAAARKADDARETAAGIGQGTVGVTLDLTDPVAAEKRAKAIDAEHGGIDILINNAAILTEGNALEIETAVLMESLAVNTVAPFALIHAIAPGMKTRGWGRIVNLSSGWGAFAEGLSGPSAYAISKAALNAVTVSFALALGSEVKVNAACPGWVRTRMGGETAALSAEEGAATPIMLATLPDDGPTGGFFRNRQPIPW